MAYRYFRLTDDAHVPGRWHLRSPRDAAGVEVDPWPFSRGVPISLPGRLNVPIDRAGTPLDFSLTGLAVPIVHVRVARLLAELAPEETQSFPVEIQGQAEQFCVLVATKTIRCIDNAASKEVELWTPEDGRPEKVGQYRDVYGMRIDPSKVGDARVFRTWGWTVALIVREDIKDALERIGATGLSFTEV
ncbi:imm11 family protein [Pyxidicoccus sp. 3LG]